MRNQKQNSANFYIRHKEKIDARNKAWYEANREKMRQYQKDLNRKQRLMVLEAYGNCCQCCGESVYEFLAIDHVNGDGAKHRKEIGERNLYRWLIKNNFPSGFQVLCHNCNFAKGHYGKCPHQMEEKWVSTT